MLDTAISIYHKKIKESLHKSHQIYQVLKCTFMYPANESSQATDKSNINIYIQNLFKNVRYKPCEC